MSAITLDLAIEQNATFRKGPMTLAAYPYAVEVLRPGVIVHADTGAPADPADLVPIDLTGCTARLQARSESNPDTPLIDLSSAPGGGITLGGTAGTIELFLSDTATAALTSSRMAYDLLILYAGGDVARVIAGQITVSPGVTIRGV